MGDDSSSRAGSMGDDLGSGIGSMGDDDSGSKTEGTDTGPMTLGGSMRKGSIK